jgi:hypothetical protein
VAANRQERYHGKELQKKQDKEPAGRMVLGVKNSFSGRVAQRQHGFGLGIIHGLVDSMFR